MNEKTEGYLRAAGWNEARRIDVSPLTNRLSQDGFAVPHCVADFLASFGDLEIEHPHYRATGETSRIRTFPRAGAGRRYRELVRDYEPRVGDSLTILGDAEDGYLVLMMDTQGAVYACYDDYLARVADSGERALEMLCSGEEIEELPPLSSSQ